MDPKNYRFLTIEEPKSVKINHVFTSHSKKFGNVSKLNFRHVYRYFAYDCATSFPGIPVGPAKKHSDVICTSQYSDVAPSTGGEVSSVIIFNCTDFKSLINDNKNH